ncbi:MAG: Uncharacterized protein FD145_257 [Candidatus Saganbacteria bacterium]|uniref:Nucleotidyl transferase AbiEii/AbiGii toxin family protein n=1 Tax=Candidatus Saganbacteria bacterium TaxID=2575572 RepID=A0A833L2A5_UNCSA|nr:MAG: Uncharacterized protein FD145_257 [Candidatus Saganbacteria bacterium]
MSNQILAALKIKIDDLATHKTLDVEIKRNALKEDLQYYVLNFIYHHPQYSDWIMYGGSALRICHGLDRMSVDLDFEIKSEITTPFLREIKEAIEKHFSNTYGTEADFLTVKTTGVRGLLLRFHIGDELGLGHPSKQVHVKIDLHHFTAPKTVVERRPINRDQLSFVITTYNMSALMASKIAAIFLRGQRGVGDAVYEEKGRDIYDLLWYMTKKVVPDLDYLVAKKIDVKDLRALFDKLTLQMNKVNNVNLKHDLTPLFVNQIFIENWLKNWRESYLRLLEDYKINTATKLESMEVHQDFDTDNYFLIYTYNTEEERSTRIRCIISDYWITDREGDLPTKINDKVVQLVISDIKGQLSDKLKQYVTLFYDKVEAYLKKTNRVMLGNSISTKVIRMTADNLNQKEQIVLNKSALLSCELDDLFK